MQMAWLGLFLYSMQKGVFNDENLMEIHSSYMGFAMFEGEYT